jgi:excisionase family DNA binding protein
LPRIVKTLVSPKQVAQAINVSESSLKRWCDQGMLTATRTAGGHRRLAVNEVLHFLRQSGQKIVRPELLGLPSNTGATAVVIDRAAEQLHAGLVSGDEERCRRLVVDLFLAGHPISDICDRVLAPAFHDIGHQWEQGEVTIYRERRACEISIKLLLELRLAVRTPDAAAPRAVGGTLEHDPYRVPTTMIEVVLRESGWQATSLGTQLPASTFAEAIDECRPELVWLSVSAIESVPDFLQDYSRLHATAKKCNAMIVVGGRALATDIRQQMAYTAYCDTLHHLSTFADSISDRTGRRATRPDA